MATHLSRKAHLFADFLAVMREGGIRQAADVISISQPALTRRIQDLEETLGVPLFERTARGMAPTKFGQTLARHAHAVELACADATAEIADLSGGRTGELRIAAGTAWMHALLPDAIAALRQRHPGVRVELVTQMLDGIARLAVGELDIVVGAAPLIGSAEAVVYTPLLDIHPLVVASATHPLARAKAANPGDLLGYPWVWLGETDAVKPDIDGYFTSCGLAPPRFAIGTSSVPAGLRLVQQTEHLMCIPSTLGGLASANDLVQLRLAVPLRPYSAGLIYRSGTARLTSFREFRLALEHAVHGFSRSERHDTLDP